MVFASVPFVSFFVIFFCIYWFFLNGKLNYQNVLVLVGSYFFYAWADWRFLVLLILISILNYFLGIYIEKSENEQLKRNLVLIGLIQGIGGLFLFKYLDFFIVSLNQLFSAFSLNLKIRSSNIIAPLGISFFTFKTISYLLDISKRKIQATKDWVAFFIYVAFFPTILSGPIDKAKSFIPQLFKPRHFDYANASDAMRQILWGLFKKSVVADNCATLTNSIFDNYKDMPASSLLLGAILYSFQMYTDFSGYSDMAIGISRLIGFNVTKNFDYPFFAQNIAEYWRKWHISLTSWLTEYVFTPLSISFRNFGDFGLILAIVLNFAICGIWHGANWTYLVFGILHGLYFIPLILKGTMNKKKKVANNRSIPTFKEFLNMLLTFFLATIAFIVFRADSLVQAIGYYKGLFSLSIFTIPQTDLHILIYLLLFIIFTLVVEWIGRNKDFAVSQLSVRWPKFLRWSFYIVVFISILVFKASEQQFIYLKF